MVFSVGGIKKMMLESKVYYCNIIQFCVKLGKSPMETFQMMKEAEIGKTVKILVFKGHNRFKAGRETSNDDKCTGCPSIVTAKGNSFLLKEKN